MEILQIYSQGLEILLPGSPRGLSQNLLVCYLLCLHLISYYFQSCRSLQNNADESDASKLEELEKLLTQALRNTKSKKVHLNGSFDILNQLSYN
jgi:hypothetical protein